MTDNIEKRNKDIFPIGLNRRDELVVELVNDLRESGVWDQMSWMSLPISGDGTNLKKKFPETAFRPMPSTLPYAVECPHLNARAREWLDTQATGNWDVSFKSPLQVNFENAEDAVLFRMFI